MAPPRKPTALKILGGNPGRRPLNMLEPSFPASDGAPPTYLNVAGRREWRRLYPHVYQQGLFTVVDLAEFGGYCQAYSEIPELIRFLRKHGRTFETATGYLVPRPEVAMLERAWARVHTFATSFGFSPSARSRIKANPQKDEDPFEAFLTKDS